MSETNHFIAANIYFLRQGKDFISTLSREAYTASAPPLYKSGIGPHFRHCLDHYQSFLNGMSDREIDYDARVRMTDVETDPVAATALIDSLIADLEQVSSDALEWTLQSKTDCGKNTASPWSFSSVRRELQFLVSHTVHHYALIALIARHQGNDPGADFGVAPSTLKYQESQARCAP